MVSVRMRDERNDGGGWGGGGGGGEGGVMSCLWWAVRVRYRPGHIWRPTQLNSSKGLKAT